MRKWIAGPFLACALLLCAPCGAAEAPATAETAERETPAQARETKAPAPAAERPWMEALFPVPEGEAAVTVQRRSAFYMGRSDTPLGVLYYDLPVVEGCPGADAISRALAAECDAFFSDANADAFREQVGFLSAREIAGERFDQPYAHTLSAEITQNGDGVLCVHQMRDWIIGGVHNGWDSGRTFDLETGEPLPLEHFLPLEFADFQGRLTAFLTEQADVWGYGEVLAGEAAEQAADLFSLEFRKAFSDYGFYVQGDDLYVALPFVNIEWLLRWPLGAEAPAELLPGYAGWWGRRE